MSRSKATDSGFEIKKAGSVGSILANLFRRILEGNGVGPDRYSALMQRYIFKAHATSELNRKERVTARETLSKELLKPVMTFKTFFKGLIFLAPTKIEFSIRLWFPNGREFATSEIVIFDDEIKDAIELGSKGDSDDAE